MAFLEVTLLNTKPTKLSTPPFDGPDEEPAYKPAPQREASGSAGARHAEGSRLPSFGRWAAAGGVLLAVVGCAAAAALGATVRWGRAQASGGLATGGGVALYNSAGEYNDLKSRDRLEEMGNVWSAERMLVDSGVCPAQLEEVELLREQRWPRPLAEQAPAIEQVLYINSERNTGRRQFMERQLTNLSQAWKARGATLGWQRVAGVVRESSEVAGARNLSPGRAAALSHARAIFSIQEQAAGLTVIVEDDVTLHGDFLRLWEELWPYVPQEWDVLRLGWFGDHQACDQVVNAKLDRAGWQDPMNGECAFCGTQAYVVNPASKEKVLKRFEQAPLPRKDELLGAPVPRGEELDGVPELLAYATWPLLASSHFGRAPPAAAGDRLRGRRAAPRQPPAAPPARGEAQRPAAEPATSSAPNMERPPPAPTEGAAAIQRTQQKAAGEQEAREQLRGQKAPPSAAAAATLTARRPPPARPAVAAATASELPVGWPPQGRRDAPGVGWHRYHGQETNSTSNSSTNSSSNRPQRTAARTPPRPHLTREAAMEQVLEALLAARAP